VWIDGDVASRCFRTSPTLAVILLLITVTIYPGTHMNISSVSFFGFCSDSTVFSINNESVAVILIFQIPTLNSHARRSVSIVQLNLSSFESNIAPFACSAAVIHRTVVL